MVTFKEVTLYGKSDFLLNQELFLKERIRSLWEQILSFKRSSHFEKRHTWREPLLDPVVCLWCVTFFRVLAMPLNAYAASEYLGLKAA